MVINVISHAIKSRCVALTSRDQETLLSFLFCPSALLCLAMTPQGPVFYNISIGIYWYPYQ